METPRDKYVEKVRKLLAHAERAGTVEEGETFLAKATDLMAQWEIADQEVRDLGQQTAVVRREVILGTYSPDVDCAAMSAIADVFGIVVGFLPYHGAGTKPMAVMLGRSDDLERFEMLWATLQIQLVGAMKQGERETYLADRNHTRRWRRSFKLSWCYRVARRLREQRSTYGAALVLVKDDVQQAADEQFTQGRKRKIGVDPEGMRAGDYAGKHADLGGGRLGNDTKGALS
jgi:hypothetical protein